MWAKSLVALFLVVSASACSHVTPINSEGPEAPERSPSRAPQSIIEINEQSIDLKPGGLSLYQLRRGERITVDRVTTQIGSNTAGGKDADGKLWTLDFWTARGEKISYPLTDSEGRQTSKEFKAIGQLLDLLKDRSLFKAPRLSGLYTPTAFIDELCLALRLADRKLLYLSGSRLSDTNILEYLNRIDQKIEKTKPKDECKIQ